MTDTLITSIPQVDGGTREVHAQDAAHAELARDILRDDPAMIDHINGVEGIVIRTVDRAERKMRTITLTGRPPVRIIEAEWPVIAIAEGDSYDGYDGAVHDQASRRGELDEWWLRVRQHADGRAIVYGRYTPGWSPQGEDWAGGELLAPGADIASAINRVGDSRIPDRCVRECIADLPAEEV